MEAQTEQFLTEQGIWNDVQNVKLTRSSLAEMLEKYKDKSQHLTRCQFVDLAKVVELCIQNDPDYKGSISGGYFTERFNNAWKNYSSKFVLIP